jgi:hypothetical protein
MYIYLHFVFQDAMSFLSSLHFMQHEEAKNWLAFIRQAEINSFE